jgi:hypothetical protein
MLDQAIDAFDSYIRVAIHAHSAPALTVVMSWITILGSPLFLFIASTVAAAMFWRRGRCDDAASMAITMLGASILNMTLKMFVSFVLALIQRRIRLETAAERANTDFPSFTERRTGRGLCHWYASSQR